MKRIILTLLSTVITLIVFAQEADTTIVVYYGYQAIDTITISKSSETYLQIQEAESVVQGITDEPTKHRAIVECVEPSRQRRLFIFDEIPFGNHQLQEMPPRSE